MILVSWCAWSNQLAAVKDNTAAVSLSASLVQKPIGTVSTLHLMQLLSSPLDWSHQTCLSALPGGRLAI